MKVTWKLRALAAGVTAALAVGSSLIAGSPAAAKPPPLSCSLRLTNPVESVDAGAVYSIGEVICNKSVLWLGARVWLYRDNTYMREVVVDLRNNSYAYALNMIYPCVPGNYRVNGILWVNNGTRADGGPEYYMNVSGPGSSPSIPVDCVL